MQDTILEEVCRFGPGRNKSYNKIIEDDVGLASWYAYRARLTPAKIRIALKNNRDIQEYEAAKDEGPPARWGYYVGDHYEEFVDGYGDGFLDGGY